MLRSSAYRDAIQEPIVTQRDGRYVIPVKADKKGDLRGIVHDVSASGATVFIEPLSVVELGNDWREAQLEEQREVERILRELSGLVGESARGHHRHDRGARRPRPRAGEGALRRTSCTRTSCRTQAPSSRGSSNAPASCDCSTRGTRCSARTPCR